jgi:hypothetical protein
MEKMEHQVEEEVLVELGLKDLTVVVMEEEEEEHLKLEQVDL